MNRVEKVLLRTKGRKAGTLAIVIGPMLAVWSAWTCRRARPLGQHGSAGRTLWRRTGYAHNIARCRKIVAQAYFASLAQLVEQDPYKITVGGSIPSGRTNMALSFNGQDDCLSSSRCGFDSRWGRQFQFCPWPCDDGDKLPLWVMAQILPASAIPRQ